MLCHVAGAQVNHMQHLRSAGGRERCSFDQATVYGIGMLVFLAYWLLFNGVTMEELRQLMAGSTEMPVHLVRSCCYRWQLHLLTRDSHAWF